MRIAVAFAFGEFDENNWLNSPNFIIGARVQYYAQRGFAIITQKDISYFINIWSRMYSVPQPEGRYLSTYDIAEATLKYVVNSGCSEIETEIIVLAAKPHKWRCIRDLRKMGFNKVSSDTVLDYFFWYSTASLQKWTRTWWNWWKREIALRLLPWPLYVQLTRRKW